MSDALIALTALITSLPADASPYDAIAVWLRASVSGTLPDWYRAVIITNAVVFALILVLALGTIVCKIYDRQACASRRTESL